MLFARARIFLVTASIATLVAACTNQHLQQPVPPAIAAAVPATGLPPDSPDTLAVLVSNFDFGPSMSDADTEARYYCSLRAREATFIRRDLPPELRAPTLLNGVKPSFAVMTYRCVTPAEAAATPLK